MLLGLKSVLRPYFCLHKTKYLNTFHILHTNYCILYYETKYALNITHFGLYYIIVYKVMTRFVKPISTECLMNCKEKSTKK